MAADDGGATRSERARWLHELFMGVYFSDRLTEAKNAIEYRYDNHLRALLEIRMNDRHVPIDDQDVLLLDNLDSFLNYIEHVLGLERLELITRDERQVIFDYWPNIIGRDEKFAALRRYIAMCGYELITSELSLENIDYLVVYGSLMRGFNPPHQPSFVEHLEYVGEVKVPGTLYQVSEETSYPYPGLRLLEEPESRVLHPSRRTSRHAERQAERAATATTAELFRLLDATLFESMDRWEGYDATDPESSPYVRRIVRMLEPAVDAWVYLGNHADQTQAIEARSWKAYVAGQT